MMVVCIYGSTDFSPFPVTSSRGSWSPRQPSTTRCNPVQQLVPVHIITSQYNSWCLFTSSLPSTTAGACSHHHFPVQLAATQYNSLGSCLLRQPSTTAGAWPCSCTGSGLYLWLRFVGKLVLTSGTGATQLPTL
jgi:hypothetical protein